MKVAFDHQIFTFQRYGGASRYIFELASRLPDHGVPETSVIAPLYINNYLAADSARGFTHGRHVPSALGEAWIRVRDCLPLLDILNRLVAPVTWRRANPDIVHETYYTTTKPVGRARRRVVTVYDMTHDLFPEEFPFVEQTIAAKRAAVNRVDRVICISENTRQDLIRLYDVDPARTSVVHLGHSLTVKPNAAQADIGGRKPWLLYVGHRTGYKNFMTLLRAFGSSPVLREFELIAFGGLPMLPDEQEEITRLGITDRVRFESGSDQQLAARYEGATAFVYPSKYEGFGIPPLEAMSHGCPVVCSNAGSIPEVVGDAGLYFDPNNPEELRTALERIATTETLQTDLRQRGYTRIGAFSWDRCAAETAQIYREIT